MTEMETDPKLSPSATPDLLEGGAAEVKKVDQRKRPLLIIGGAVLVLILIVVVTLGAGGREGRKGILVKGDKRAQVVNSEGANAVLKDTPEAGVVVAEAPGTDGGIILTEAPLLDTMPSQAQQPGYTDPTSGGQPASRYAAAWQQYDQDRATASRDRTKAGADAVSSDLRIQTSAGANRGQSAAAPGDPYAELLRQLASEGGSAAQGGPQSAGSPGLAGGMGGDDDLNRQRDKDAFLRGSGGRSPYAAGRIQNQASPFEVKAGTYIPLVFVGGVNSDLPGQVVARVSRNVFDTATGRYLLIPQGTTVLGSYDSQVTHGQSRVLIAWNRLIYPDGSSIDIGSMSSTDRSGMAGARDQINRHSLRTYGNAVFLSIFSAGAQLSQPQASNGENVSAGQTVAAAMGQQIGQLGMESARRGLQVQPTLQIRPGFQGNLLVQQDLVLREWRRQR